MSSNITEIWKSERDKIYHFLKEKPATGSMICKATGILHKNLTRHVASLREAGRLIDLGKVRCPVTGFKASLLTTDEKLFPQPGQQQLNLN
jgi:hypothetical protein